MSAPLYCVCFMLCGSTAKGLHLALSRCSSRYLCAFASRLCNSMNWTGPVSRSGAVSVLLALQFELQDLDDGGPHIILFAMLTTGVYAAALCPVHHHDRGPFL